MCGQSLRRLASSRCHCQPSIIEFVRSASAFPVVAVIEVANAANEQQLTTQADLSLHRVHRESATGDLSDLITDKLRELEFPGGNIFAWASGEASSLRNVRRHLLNERNIPAGRMRMTGDWKRALANYDHHLPLE